MLPRGNTPDTCRVKLIEPDVCAAAGLIGITDYKINMFEWFVKNKVIPYGEIPGADPGILVIDDPTGSCNFTKDIWSNLFSNFRHLCKKPGQKEGEFSIIIGSHYAFKVPRVVREAATHAGIFQQMTKASITAIYEVFGQGAFETYKDFLAYMKRFTSKDRKLFIWFDRSPTNGVQFQPVICPKMKP